MLKRVWRGVVGVMVVAVMVRVAGGEVPVRWVDGGGPGEKVGVSFGVPFGVGEVKRGAAFVVQGEEGAGAVQSWPLAYWPDGSVKWMGMAAVVGGKAGEVKVVDGANTNLRAAVGVKVEQTGDGVVVTNGRAVYRIPLKGDALIGSIVVEGREVATKGRLVGMVEDRTGVGGGPGAKSVREVEFGTNVTGVTVEQDGPVRAVVKIEGKHSGNGREWLPFVVRLYFYGGVDEVRMVHSFVFDGDQEKDFIKGLGVRFTVPFREEAQNRHVRMAGSQGMWAEPVKPLNGRRPPRGEILPDQAAGKRIPQMSEMANLAPMAEWDGYRQMQLSADGYRIEKRTGPQGAWIPVVGGGRALGLAFVGDVTGGVAVGIKNFWQMFPTGMEIEGADGKAAELTAWLYSPEAETMDMRHYDDKEHGLDASYEDITPGLSTATGVARTHELVFCAFGAVPTNGELTAMAERDAKRPQLAATPEYLHSKGALGVWSLVDKSVPAKAAIEKKLENALAFYQGQIEQRKWYGFWDFGDVMHSYDASRHEWKYDIGGFAWDNTELATDMWLWYSFLRTGRADIYRMAEAMTRCTQEVDAYHIGPMKGLGSRHNVRHWGDGAKEARISQAALKRFYYYLSTDERTGDLMNEVIDADLALLNVDPLRKVEQDQTYKAHVRAGPDWFAFAGNWLTAWERTGDEKYLQRVMVGVKDFEGMKKKLFSGGIFGYDPATKEVKQLHEEAAMPHLAALMGGPELFFEMTPVMNKPEWTAMFLEYCRYLQSPAGEAEAALGNRLREEQSGPWYAGLTAYAARTLKDPALADRAWAEFAKGDAASKTGWEARELSGPDVPEKVAEIPAVSTNDTSQWCLNAILLLELVGDRVPR